MNTAEYNNFANKLITKIKRLDPNQFLALKKYVDKEANRRYAERKKL